jgi:hypothetical protein
MTEQRNDVSDWWTSKIVDMTPEPITAFSRA